LDTVIFTPNQIVSSLNCGLNCGAKNRLLMSLC
jgi:hypothetical protein